MKKYSILLAITALIIASLACQTLMGGGAPNEVPVDSQPPVDNSGDTPTEESSDDSNFSFGGDSDFPMPDDASNVVDVAGTTNYQTNLSLDEVLAFYRDAYTSQGYTEREILTTTADGVFSIVFDGDPSGKAVVIQGVDFGDGTTNVNISLQDI